MPQKVLISVWVVWLISWWVAAFWTDRVAKRLDASVELVYRLPTLVAVLLLFGVVRWSADPVWLRTARHPGLAWTLVGLTIAGLAFTWWARIHLGRLWSATVTRKKDHHIIDTGPYRLVRHPIYTGILFAALASACMRGTVLPMIGYVVLAVSFYIKARIEERFLRAELGHDAYDAYARRTPMLVPFLGGGETASRM